MNDTEKPNMTVAGDWAKPADTLINKVSEAIGGGLQPWQIRRIAKAEADAKIVAAEAEKRCKEILAAAAQPPTDIAMRAVHRMIAEEIRKQENIEKIVALATERLEEKAKPESVENDFISDLFEKAKNTSSEEMQSLWASILAGEASKSGRFSKRTIALVAELDRKDADLFTRFCSCCWLLGSTLVPLLTPRVMKEFRAKGITFTDLVHLDTIGLIDFNSIVAFQQEYEGREPPISVLLHYFGKRVIATVKNNPPKVEVGNAILTEAGRQLAEISGAKYDADIRDAALLDLMDSGIELISPWAPKTEQS